MLLCAAREDSPGTTPRLNPEVIGDRRSAHGIRYRNSEKVQLLIYCNQSRFIEFAVDEIKKLLPGEIELFCHTGKQLVANLLSTMGNLCTDSCITTVESEYQFDVL